MLQRLEDNSTPATVNSQYHHVILLTSSDFFGHLQLLNMFINSTDSQQVSAAVHSISKHLNHHTAYI
jgi:hypothetical protein